MDISKIGQGLRPDALKGAKAGTMPSLKTKPLAELGLAGLVERLAMAIREAEQRD